MAEPGASNERFFALRAIERGEFLRGIPFAESALRSSEAKYGPDDDAVSVDLIVLGTMLYKGRGDYDGAEALFLRASKIRERAYGPNDPNVGIVLTELASCQRERGDYTSALANAQRALDAWKTSSTAERSPLFAQALSVMATLRADGADDLGAEALFTRALTLAEKQLGELSADVAPYLRKLGSLYLRRGDFARAEPLFLKAMAICENELDVGDPKRADALRDLSRFYAARGDYDGAERTFVMAYRIDEAILGKDNPAVADDLTQVALLHERRGDVDYGLRFAEQALALRERVLGANHPDVAESLTVLGLLRAHSGDRAGAEPLFTRARAIREAALGPEHPAVAGSLSNLAELREAAGDVPGAVRLRARASDIRERGLATILTAGSEDQKRAYVATLAEETDATVSLHAKLAPNDAAAKRLALLTLLRRKGRVLEAMTNGMAAVRARVTPEARGKLDELASVRGQLAALVIRGPQSASASEHKKRLADLEARAQRLEGELSAQNGAVGVTEEPVTIERVQHAIPADGCLAEIASFQPLDSKAKRRSERWGARRYVAYTLGPSGEPAFADLGDATAVDGEVTALRAALSNASRQDTDALSRKLGARVLDPILRSCGGAKHVLVSPDGALNLVPFGALTDAQGRFAVETTAFTYLSTGRDVLRPMASAASATPVVVADPDFGTATGREPAQGSALARARFTPLPGTEGEARALAKLLPDVKVLTGGQATKAAVRALTAPRILHVATHGFFLSGLPTVARNSRALVLDVGSGEPVAPGSDNPLLRSGLVFAGANGGAAAATEGVMTALEASSLNLWGTKLVVLSACETGVGEVTSSEGVYGLRRALVIAGAESQVMSLWKVDDEATRDLMVGYYTRLANGEGRTEALRAAQLALLEQDRYHHPYFWASFIPSGDWQPLEHKAQSGAPDAARLERVQTPSGCGCSVPGETGGANAALAATFVGLATAVRRRRRAR